MEFVILFLIMVVLLFLKGFFSGSEIALVNADRVKLRNKADKGNKGAALVLKLFENPEALLSTTLIGTNIATVALVTVGTSLMIRAFGTIGDLIGVLCLTPLLLIIGEIVPKSVYQQKSDYLAPLIVYPLRTFSILFAPVIFVFSRTARLVASMVGIKRPEQTVFVIREQLRTMVEMAEGLSNVGVFDRVRIRHALRFSETTVGETMTPIAEVAAIEKGQSIHDAIHLVHNMGYTRIPVYEGSITNIVGILSLTAWELVDRRLFQQSLDELLRPVPYVSDHQPIEQVLPMLTQREDPLAVVVDEFGSAMGIITVEDILEQVVGRVDAGEKLQTTKKHIRTIEKLDEDLYMMDAHVPISEVNEELGIDLPAKEFHTIGGMIMARLRHIPQTNEYVTEKGYRFTVTEATERSVVKLRVEREGWTGAEDSD
jgi:CBS domain containing-hemolysin-like protein